MPPQRTTPPAKALKTERTHEENQERAYIAASRRSDRSLEARVESARRASEIHKRRTGRSLRVTEQDVVNEEMYEEEDDDLPHQYRRLTAHLQTGSPEFNRKLSAYLTNHVAMRTALDQAITNSYAQQYPNAPQFAHNNSFYPSPFMANNMPQQQSQQTYMQPYPTPGTPGYRPRHQARSSSGSHGTTSYSPHAPVPSPVQAAPQMDRRRPSSSSKSSPHSPPGATSTPQLMQQSRPATAHGSPDHNVKQEDSSSRQMRAPPQPSPPQQLQQSPLGTMNGFANMGPFTTSLPMESQMLLGSALDPNDPMTAMLMAGSENMPQPYNYATQSTLSKTPNVRQAFDGMSATLAPSALDMSPRHQNIGHPQSTIATMPSSTPAFQYAFDQGTPDFSKGHMFASGTSSCGSGPVTPGGIDGGWDAFINDNSWAENVT